jgi:DNA polymerase elongation subunit (family B)
MSGAGARIPHYSPDNVCDTAKLGGYTRAAATKRTAALQLAAQRKSPPPCRLVLYGRLATGHTAAVVVRGFRPGIFVEATEPWMVHRPKELAAALCQKLWLKEGTLQAAPRTLKNMLEIKAGDIHPTQLSPAGEPLRVNRQWLWVSAPEPSLLRSIDRLHGTAIPLATGAREVLIRTAEGNVDAAFQGMLAMGASYEGFVQLHGVRTCPSPTAKEFHADLECSVDIDRVVAWRDAADRPAGVPHPGAPAFPLLMAGFDIEARSQRGSDLRAAATAAGLPADMDAMCNADNPQDVAFTTCVSYMWLHAVPPGAAAGVANGTLPPNCAAIDTVFFRMALVATRSVPLPVEGMVTLHNRDERVVLHALRDAWAVVLRPQIVSGYNSSRFDVPYLCTRARVVGAERFMYMSGAIASRCAAATQEIKSAQTGVATMVFWGDAEAVTVKAWGSRPSPRVKYTASLGMTCIDMWWWVRNRFKLETYTLQAVSGALLGGEEGKFDMPYALLYAASEGSPLDVAKVVAYCGQDTDLVMRLAAKTAMGSELMQSCRIMAVCAHEFIQQKQGVRLHHQLVREAREGGWVMNQVAMAPSEAYDGGRVEEPIRGLYTDPVVVFDYASMYPSIMISINLCSSTFVSGLPPSHAAGAAASPADVARIAHSLGMPLSRAAAMADLVSVPPTEHVARVLGVSPPVARALRLASFTVKPGRSFVFALGVAGVMKPLLETLGAARKAAKRVMAEEKKAVAAAVAAGDTAAAADHGSGVKMADALQSALKVVMNSVYGGCAARSTSSFSFPPLSQTTTAYGRHMIQRAQVCAMQEFGCSMVYGDTDSIMVTLPEAAYGGAGCTQARMAAAFAYTTSPQLADGRAGMEARLTEVSGVVMEMEAIAVRSLFTEVKKKYAMLFFESAGEYAANPAGGTVKMRGNDAVRRDATAIGRQITRDVNVSILRSPEDDLVGAALLVLQAGMARLASRELPVEDLVSTGEVKGSYGDTLAVPAQLAVSWAKTRAMPGYEVQSGDRVKFVRVTSADNSRLVPPPTIAAARYEELVLKKPTTQLGVQNAVHNNRKRQPASDDSAAAENKRRRGGVQQRTLGFSSRGARVRAAKGPTPHDAAIAAMQAVAAANGVPFDYAEARKMWPSDGAVAAYCRAPSELPHTRDVDYRHYVTDVFGSVLQAFDNAVVPGTPLTTVGGRRKAYVDRMQKLSVGAAVTGAPAPALAARRIAEAAYAKAGGVHGTRLVQRPLM